MIHTKGFINNMGIFTRFFALLLLLLVTGNAAAVNHFIPIDTSSPRATMASFLALSEEAANRYDEFRDSPSPETQKALLHISVKAEQLFDLSKIAPANRSKIADETYYLLWDSVARLKLPDLEEIPGTTLDQSDESKDSLPSRWRIPNSEITIALVKEGPDAGEYLFSQSTVKNARSYYESLRELPYVQPMRIKDVYRINELITGWMVPPSWTEQLPDWANYAVFGQIVWKWIASLLLTTIGLGFIILVYRWSRHNADSGSLSSFLLNMSTPLTILIVLPIVRYIAREQIHVTGMALELSHYLLFVSYGVTLVWVVWLSANHIVEVIIDSPRVKDESLDASLLRLVARSIGVIAILVLVIRILNELGVPVYGLVTGAGVGGIAIALSAKYTLENFMGALNLFADRPVRVGDLCRFDDESTPGFSPVGRVESIGLRSTKIRRIDRFLITIPNAEFAQRNIVNLSVNDKFVLSTVLGLRYETTDDQLRFVLAELRAMLHAHPMTMHTSNDPIRVRFTGFGDYSLNVSIRVFIRTKNYNEFLAIEEDLLLRMNTIVQQAGTGFAFPSRTLYLTRDSGLDEEAQQAAEKQVREWAAAYELPFPEFSDEQLKKISDTLDYPPEGSPDADRG